MSARATTASRASLSERRQVWTGHLWEPEWFSAFDGIGCGELLSILQPQAITDLLSGFLDAGADAVSTNTFGATPAVMITNGVAPELAEETAFEANFQSARLARSAAKEFSGSSRERWVLGSMGPTLHCLSIQGTSKAKTDQVVAEYYSQARALLEGGVDVLHLEGCIDLLNVRAALVALQRLDEEHQLGAPVMLTARIEATGLLLDASSPAQFMALAEEFDPLVVGLTGRNFDEFPRMIGGTDSWIAALPDVFAVGSAEGRFETPRSLVDRLMTIAHDRRVSVIGVGCGSRPEYVKAIVEAFG